jgi:hypothetical protein
MTRDRQGFNTATANTAAAILAAAAMMKAISQLPVSLIPPLFYAGTRPRVIGRYFSATPEKAPHRFDILRRKVRQQGRPSH